MQSLLRPLSQFSPQAAHTFGGYCTATTLYVPAGIIGREDEAGFTLSPTANMSKFLSVLV